MRKEKIVPIVYVRNDIIINDRLRDGTTLKYEVLKLARCSFSREKNL